ESLGRAARASFRAWVAHLGGDGRPASHAAGDGRGRSYQCALFWAAHAAWIARAARELDGCLALPEPAAPGRDAIEVGVRWFPDAQLARIEDVAVIAWLRGARPAVN